MAQTKLTAKSIENTNPNPDRDELLWDESFPGFGVRVSKKGVKSWVLQYAAPDGRRPRLTLGRVGPITLTQARRIAAQKLHQVASGIDPARERMRRRSAPTLRDLRNRFLEEHGSRRSASSRKLYRSSFAELIAVLGETSLVESLRWDDVARVHSGMSDRPFLANRVLTTVHTALEQARKWGWYPRDLVNPAAGHELYPEPARGAVAHLRAGVRHRRSSCRGAAELLSRRLYAGAHAHRCPAL